MSNIQLLAVCPGCDDNHVGIECKKPSFIVPTIVKLNCDKCESTILYRVTIPKDRSNRTQFNYAALQIKPSVKLIEMMNEVVKKKNEEKKEEITHEVAVK